MSAITILTFKAEHILQIRQQQHDIIELQGFTQEHYKKIEALPHQWSISVDGVIKACGGIVLYWKGRGEAWAMIGDDTRKDFVGIIRAIKKILSITDCDRIEATVIKDFKAGHRLVKLLGFDLEAQTMRKYGIKGWDYSLYARVK
jgi:hypothetical protein